MDVSEGDKTLSSIGLKFPFWQGGDDQLKTVVDEVKELVVGQLSVTIDGIPVFFVHVVARDDRGAVLLPQLEGVFGFTLGVETQAVHLIQTDKQKDFSADFEDKGVRSKGQFLRHSGFAEAIFP